MVTFDLLLLIGYLHGVSVEVCDTQCVLVALNVSDAEFGRLS